MRYHLLNQITAAYHDLRGLVKFSSGFIQIFSRSFHILLVVYHI